MIKFISILVSAMSLNFMVSYSATEGGQPIGVALEFSNNAIGIESGQPVFSTDTKVWISNPSKEQVKLYLNEMEKEANESKIELSEMTEMKEGTYTLIVIGKDDQDNRTESTFGFTIQ